MKRVEEKERKRDQMKKRMMEKIQEIIDNIDEISSIEEKLNRYEMIKKILRDMEDHIFDEIFDHN